MNNIEVITVRAQDETEDEKAWRVEGVADEKRRGWIVVFNLMSVVIVVSVVKGRDPFRRM